MLERVEQRAAGGLTQVQICDYLGVSRRQFIEWAHDPEHPVGLAYRRGRATMLAKVAQNTIQMALAGDPQSMRYVLSTIGGWKESSTIEHTGPDGSSLEVHVTRRIVDPVSDAED